MNDYQSDQNDRYGALLLEPLRQEPSGRSHVDIARAITEGRRRSRHRWWAGGTVVVALTATAAGGGTLAISALDGPRYGLAPLPAHSQNQLAWNEAAIRCTITRLPTAGMAKAAVTGGDPSGHYLVGRLDRTDSSARTVVWRDGTIAATFRMPGEDSELSDVNTAGVAVGSGVDKNGNSRAYVYRDRKVSPLAGGYGFANALDDAGVIVGALGFMFQQRPARWSSATAEPESLPMPAGASTGTADDIDADGTVLGRVAATAGAEPSAYLWMPDGTARAMPLPMIGPQRANSFSAAAIRNGRVIGLARVGTSSGRSTFIPFQYSIAANRYERLSPAAGAPSRIAANGWVAGTSMLISDLASVWQYGPDSEPGPARLTRAGSLVTLPSFGRDHDPTMVSSISDDGSVVGGYRTDSSGNEPLMWRCG